jgi:phosphotransferase system enzyme I (PtsI)
MGFRAIRFCLETPEIFMVQLRAILRASSHGNVKIMFPMISGVEELRRAKGMLEQAKTDLRNEGIAFDESMPVGAMIEIPSAALTIDLLAKEVDFLSLGTNDLIQYLMAVDRLNDRVAHLYEPAHPAVLRTLKQIFDSARVAQVPVSVCGEIAGDPLFASLLLGMGADSLSMASGLLPELKFYLRKLHLQRAQDLVEEVMKIEDPAKVMGRLQEFHDQNLGPVGVLAG